MCWDNKSPIKWTKRRTSNPCPKHEVWSSHDKDKRMQQDKSNGWGTRLSWEKFMSVCDRQWYKGWADGVVPSPRQSEHRQATISRFPVPRHDVWHLCAPSRCETSRQGTKMWGFHVRQRSCLKLSPLMRRIRKNFVLQCQSVRIGKGVLIGNPRGPRDGKCRLLLVQQTYEYTTVSLWYYLVQVARRYVKCRHRETKAVYVRVDTKWHTTQTQRSFIFTSFHEVSLKHNWLIRWAACHSVKT